MEFKRVSDLRDVAVIVAFDGWNDAGSAATDTVAMLMETYPCEEVGRIDDERYYDFLATRPHIHRAPDGPWLEWPATVFYVVRHPERDLVVVRGPEPSLLWRSYSAELVSRVKEFDPQLVVLVGALLSDTPHSRPLPVSFTSHDAAVRQRLDAMDSTYEGPTGIIGVLTQALASARVPAGSLWVSIPHYVATPPNPKGQHALLTSLESLLGIEIELDDLPSEAEKWTAAVDELSQEDPDVAEYIEQLEEAKDASDVEGATGDTIAAEFERYLNRRRDDKGGFSR